MTRRILDVVTGNRRLTAALTTALRRRGGWLVGLAAMFIIGAEPASGSPAQRPTVRPMASLEVDATIHLGSKADWVAITPDAVWVGVKRPNGVARIDPETNGVTTVALPGDACAGLAADAEDLWVPLCGPVPQLAKVDLKRRALDRVFEIGPAGPEGGIAIGAGSIWLVTESGVLARIAPATGAVVATIDVPPGSYNPVFAGGLIWVTRADGAELTIVDPRTSKVLDHVAIGRGPRFATTGGGAVWTLNQGDGTLSRVSLADRTTSPALSLQTPGPGGDITFADGRVWTTMIKTPLTVVDAKSSAILCQWKGAGGDALGVGHGAVWLTDLDAGTVSRIALKNIPDDCAVHGTN